MDLLSAEQVKQIKEAATAAGNEPGEALRSFGERQRDLWKENPHASEADLKGAVKSAVQAMINRARGPRRHADTRQATAESEAQRDAMRLPETRRATRQDVPGPPSGRMLRGTESEVKQIKEAAAAAGNEPGEALRSFGERQRDLRKENTHASEADLKGAVKSAVQAMINRARGPRRHADTRQATAESEAQRDAMRLPETRRATRQDVPGHQSRRV
jgi:hypothetical protein